jgi:hypothetical protein
MLTLVGVIFSYLDRAKENTSYSGAIIQSNLFFADTSRAIDKILKRVGNDRAKRETILTTLYSAPMTLQPNESGLFITVECRPLDNRVNINWLGYEDNSSMELQYSIAQELFDTIVDRYSIDNPSLLLESILLAIKGDIVEGSRLRSRAGIVRLSQLEEIVREYQLQSGDRGVGEIRWESFFGFDKEATLIDGKYMSAELLSAIFDIDVALVKDEWFEGDDLREFVVSSGGDISKYNKKIFSPKLIERIHCSVMYSYLDEVYSFGLDYLEERSEKFEFYAKQ